MAVKNFRIERGRIRIGTPTENYAGFWFHMEVQKPTGEFNLGDVVSKATALDIARFIIESSGDEGMKLVQILLCNMSLEDVQRIGTVPMEKKLPTLDDVRGILKDEHPECQLCEGRGHFEVKPFETPLENPECPACGGKGYVEGEHYD